MHDQPRTLAPVPGLGRDDEAPRCDNCGGPVFGPVDPDAVDNECERCRVRFEGYCEGQKQSARELLELAVLHAVNDLGDDGVRSEVERLLRDRRPAYVQVS